MSDNETKEFYEKNKEIIDRIIEERERENRKNQEEHYLRAFEAFDKFRDEFSNFAKENSDYFEKNFTESQEKVKQFGEEEFGKARSYGESARERAKERFNEDFREYFGFLSDPAFQKHVVAAGLEAFAAVATVIKDAPLPDSVRETFESIKAQGSKEFCRNNSDCNVKKDTENKNTNAPVKIEVKKKEKS